MNKIEPDYEAYWADIMEDDYAMQRHAGIDLGTASFPKAKVFRIVQDIIRQGIIHDYKDVLEFDVQRILAWYGSNMIRVVDHRRRIYKR